MYLEKYDVKYTGFSIQKNTKFQISKTLEKKVRYATDFYVKIPIFSLLSIYNNTSKCDNFNFRPVFQKQEQLGYFCLWF